MGIFALFVLALSSSYLWCKNMDWRDSDTRLLQQKKITLSISVLGSPQRLENLILS